jgi:drug/metabolite transporter (DMT)-like permease
VRAIDWGRLAALAVMWSLQYIFLRVAVPAFGPGAVADGRALFGALFLVPAALAMGQRIAPLAHWKDHLAVCLPNNVLPFMCFSAAALFLPAGYLAIINGTVPLWAGVFGAWALKEPLRRRQLAGFLLGLVGVALIVNLGPVALDARSALGAALALAGAALWAWGGVVIKRRDGILPPVGLAAGATSCAAILMAPLWASATPPATWSAGPALALVSLGVLCSGFAYLAFFTLVRDIGPTRTLSTGLAAPALGVLWGWLLLHEAVTVVMLAGVALVVSSLWLVLRR